MEIHYTFLEQDHPLYREYRQLEALLLSTRAAMSAQERETWMATALAKTGHDSDLIISALLWISPVHADAPGETVQDPTARLDAVTRLVQGVMRLPEVREARQALCGEDACFDEEDDEDGPIFFGNG
jgi:hypothetical protein